MYIRHNDEETHIPIATGTYSTNFKADAEVLQKSAIEIGDNLPQTKPNVVIFTDALSVLSKPQYPHKKDLNEVETALVNIVAQTNLTLQWIPAHCRIQGNEQVDWLAREGGQPDQRDRHTSYTDKKTILKPSPRKNMEAVTPKL